MDLATVFSSCLEWENEKITGILSRKNFAPRCSAEKQNFPKSLFKRNRKVINRLFLLKNIGNLEFSRSQTKIQSSLRSHSPPWKGITEDSAILVILT
jgi:hypothetical protein